MSAESASDVRMLLGLQPIPQRPDAPPPGESAAYDQFDVHKRTLESEGQNAVDWTLLIRACERILSDEAKDIKIAVFYAFALFRRQNFVGLEVAATVIRDMIVHHWDTMLPPVRKAANRSQQLEWLAGKLGPLMPDHPPAGREGAALCACKALFEDIAAQTAERGVKPKLNDLLRPLDGLAKEIEAAAEQAREREEEARAKAEAEARNRTAPPPPTGNEAAGTGGAAGGTAPGASPSSTGSPALPAAAAIKVEPVSVASGATTQQIDTAFSTSAQGLKQIAKALLEARLSDPRPYQILRFALWGGLTLPPPNQNGKAPLMGPPPDRIKFLNGLIAAGQFQEAIPQIESSLTAQFFWLDAHRLTVAALDGLGADYAEARRVVVEALAGFLRRFPTLVDLSFQTGVPFADPATRAWIASEVLANGGAGAAAGHPWDEAADEARRLAGQGKMAEAAARFAQGRRQAGGERARLMWDLAQARFCLEIGKQAVAVSILEYLDDQIDVHNLESWEPEIALEATKLLLACYQKAAPSVPPPPGQPPPIQPQPVDNGRQARLARLRMRLARLDVGEALAVLSG